MIDYCNLITFFLCVGSWVGFMLVFTGLQKDGSFKYSCKAAILFLICGGLLVSFNRNTIKEWQYPKQTVMERRC